MLAICLALPYLAMAVAKAAPVTKPAARPFTPPRPQLVPA
jgi:hypothetical protein